MSRLPRVVVPGYPHHIVQRGNRRQTVFFDDQDKETYLEIFSAHATKAGIEIWAYCLMDNHVHFVAVPRDKTSLARGIGVAHKKYTRMIHFRKGWRGYLWQGRFFSVPLSEQYLYAALCYVERNPVRARLVQKAEDYRWSSASAHVRKTKDPLLSDSFLIAGIDDWAKYLEEEDNEERDIIVRHTSTGRPLGDETFIDRMEQITGRILRKKKPGPKGKRDKNRNEKIPQSNYS
jgi:putative transposase